LIWGKVFQLYQEVGVLEYSIINPENKTVFIYIVKKEKFIEMRLLIEEDVIQSPLFSQLDFKLEEILN
jgi:Uma2 family endonuclease